METIVEKMRDNDPELMRFVEIKELKEYLDEEQVNNLIKILDTSPSKINLIFSFLLDVGLRAEEVINLRKEDIDMIKKIVKICQHEKNGLIDWIPRSFACRREIELSREVYNLLKPFVENIKEGEFLIKSKKGKYKLNSFINIINQVLKKTPSIGCACGTQVLRRTFIIKQILAGMSLEKITKIVGHESIRVTLNFLSKCIISEGSNIIHKQNREM